MFTTLSKQKENLVIPILDQLNEENKFNLDKYKVASEILLEKFDELKKMITEGQSIMELCELFDHKLIEKVKDVYKHKSFQNGLAFPTCISVNNQSGYNSPLPEYDRILKSGDLVKIEMGLQIDGFPVVVADTLVLGELNVKQALLLDTLKEIKENLKSYIKVGSNTKDLYDYLKETTKNYECNLLSCDESIDHCPGIYSSQVSQGVIDGRNEDDKELEKHNCIFTGKNSEEFVTNHFDFEHNQCFVIDVAFSTGNGTVSVKDPRESSVYRCNPDYFYALKLKASKTTYNKLQEQSPEFPCSIRSIKDNLFDLGIKECVSNGIVEKYPVLYEKEGEYIANWKFTVILRNGNKKIKNRNIEFN